MNRVALHFHCLEAFRCNFSVASEYHICDDQPHDQGRVVIDADFLDERDAEINENGSVLAYLTVADARLLAKALLLIADDVEASNKLFALDK
jgi:hypothetical protein